MAAYAALLSLKFIITNQLQQHPRPPISLHQKHLLSLTANLSSLQNFLEAYSAGEDELESCIVAAAYAAEDIIESHIVDQIHTGSTCHVDNISCVDFSEGLERVIQDMDLIKKDVVEIVKEKKMGAQHSTNPSVSVGSIRHISRIQSNIMVDFGEILNDVMYKLTTLDSKLEIVPIVGMGGTGKTTLARNVYAHSLIVQHFHILAWVTISQEYSVRDILIQVLSEDNNWGEMCEDNKLGERVHKKLYGRRYLVVMDDIWSIEVWDKVKTFFPNNNNGSKIMITTRLSHLAYRLSGSHDFQMNFFDEDKSWSLFCKIVFGKEADCPAGLENIGKKIVKSCRGLPLSITVIGGLLTKSNMTKVYWEYILKNLSSQINLGNNENCLQVLSRSYKELSMHLKPCFLYMGVFPEDYEIHVSDLIKIWVAEGILKPVENKSFEVVAEDYVEELIERNLIIVHELHWNRKTKSCKIHDLLRDLCLREGKKQRFICILRPRDVNNIPQDINMERRICIHDRRGKIYPRFIHAIESALFIRSLIVIGDGFYRPPPSSTCKLLRLLSCANNERSSWKGNADAEAVFQQANLRYLSPGTLEEENGIRTSWNRLWNLQILDVVFYDDTSRVDIAPSEFWKMSHLRHVKFYRLQLPNPPPGELDDQFVLKNLQTLSGILNFRCSEEVVKRIPNIRKLKLFYDGDRVEEEGLHSFCLINLRLLQNLKSLHLEFDDYDEHSDPVTMENLISLPHSLKKLCLSNTRFLWEDLNTKVGSLPLLEALNLHNNYLGFEWETIEEQFPSLKFLRIEDWHLKCWTSDDSHFPRLEHLVLEFLYELEEIPLSIGDISTLQSIKVDHCSKSVVASAERIKEEQLSFGNENLQVLIIVAMDDVSDLEIILRGVQAMCASFNSMIILFAFAYKLRRRLHSQRHPPARRPKKYLISNKIPRQLEHIRNLTLVSDDSCINHLRMSRDSFSRLCYLLENLGGLQPTKHLHIPEQVAIFLSILAHHKKNRVVKDDFLRSGHTISLHFNSVLKTVLRLHTVLLVDPKPIDTDESTERWRFFKGCLGALDGTYIPVKVPIPEKPKYRNRKGFVSVNVLGVCDRDLNYSYVLTGWEGSAADSRVLRDAITRPNGLKVPIGNYYLCDGGYTNGNGFLAPFRGVRYHLQEWHNSSQPPQTPQEYYNLMHARARNVIERSFGVLKARWGILRSNSYYPIRTQNHIILACCLIHNFIRTNSSIDPIESEVPEIFHNPDFEPPTEVAYVEQVESSQEWSALRESIVQEMWNARAV